MGLPKATSVKLTVLAKKWNMSESDLVHWIADGQMGAYCWYDGFADGPLGNIEFSSRPYRDLVKIAGQDLQPLQFKKSVTVDHFFSDNTEPPLRLTPTQKLGNGLYAKRQFDITIDELVIKKSDIEHMEEKHPELLRETTDSPSVEQSEMEKQLAPNLEACLPKVLNPSHPWHSEYLALAIECWLDLYANREGTKGDNAYKPPGGHTKLIEDWLKKKIPSMGNTTQEHFRVIINPSKQGGPQKHPE